MPANSIDDRKTHNQPAASRAQPLPPGLAAGAHVVARGSARRLEAVVAHDDCCELHLGAPGSAQRQVLLWPFDRPATREARGSLRVVQLRRWRRTLAALTASEIDPQTPRARPAAVEIVPYQLAPAVAVAAGARRVLLADEVGLGKTIQAGWILADLVARDPGARALVAVPAALRLQWVDELSMRFGLAAAAVDARWLRARVADLPTDVSPWLTPGVYAISLDLLKRPDLVASVAALSWDLLVVDEAHTAAAPTERHAALASLAARARRLVTITATPCSGDAASFRSMTALGADDGEAPAVMFRRSREDVGDPRRRRHRFATVSLTPAEGRLQRLLERYSRRVWNQAPGDPSGARLAVTILRKRALSSTVAIARSLRRRVELLSSRSALPRQLALFDENDQIDDEVPAAILATPGLEDAALEQKWLRALIEAADLASGHDSKLYFVQRLVRRVPAESAVIFTEYRDTLLHLASALPPTLLLHGGLTSAERATVQARFNRDGGLLLATDAAAEGLNLHGRCRFVVNYELPWNPARLEQRIGRVDRIGQSRTVHALTLTARDTAEDLVIKNLARRLTRVVAALGRGDRLGAFLDEARTASVVIGGAGFDEPSTEVDTPVIRASADLSVATRAASQLQRSTCAAGSWTASTADVVVARVRASAHLATGAAVVVCCSAQTEDGTVVSRTFVCLHVPAVYEKPTSSRQARTLAQRALHSIPDPRTVDPRIETWFTDACAVHEAAVASAIARESFLRDRCLVTAAVQPGLFDRSAPVGSSRDVAEDAPATLEQERRTAALERSRSLHLSCRPAAVLLAWR